MIPTIEEILEGLLDGTYLLDKAVRLVDQYIEQAGLRDHFAGLAMQADVSRVGYYQRGEHMVRAASNAYAMADAMLEARKCEP